MSFARTKIQPPQPRRATLLERAPLRARLEGALATQRLVLVSAAAGYGKTSALAMACAARPAGHALAWVAADEGDDLHRLLECLVAALEPHDPPWRTAPEALIARVADPAGRAQVAAELLNALEACDTPHGIIVLDDLHRVDDGPVFEFLSTVLERLGPRWTVAIGTRHDPPLPLPRWRAQGDLAEFRPAELSFSADETLELARVAGLDAGAAARLHRHTAGWPAGVRLGLGGQALAAPGAGDRAVSDFMASEVIARIEPGLRDFLTRTSVLPELTAGRAAAVSGDGRAAQRMEEIERLGLFSSPLDATEPTLKLHDLFRAALTRELRRLHPQDWPVLWHRAAVGETDPARRIGMLLAGGHLDDAAEALAGEAPSLLTDGAVSTVNHLLDSFPGPFVATSPHLQRLLGQRAWARWDFGTMLAAMQRAEAGFIEQGRSDEARSAVAYQSLALIALGRGEEVSARLGALRREAVAPATRVVVLVACTWHALDLGSVHRIGPLLDELMDLLEASDDPTLWYQGHPLPRLNGLPGTARALDRYTRGALRLAGDRPMPLRALAHAQQGFVHAWRHGDLAAAEAALRTAQDDSRWLGHPTNVQGTIQLLAAVVHTQRGARAEALAAARALVDEHPPGRGAWSLWANMYYAARVAALFGERALLEDWLQRLEGPESASVPATQRPLLEPLRGHRAWLAGDAAGAVAHWRQALRFEAVLERLGHGLETRVALAAALVEGGQPAEAARTLAPVFDAAGNALGAALLAHFALRRLLGADWQGELAPAARQTLERWLAMVQAPAPALPEASEASESGLEGVLSGREREVLDRIAAGESNKLIARSLDLSPHTVKRHVANILDKLGLASRGQAAAWYRERA